MVVTMKGKTNSFKCCGFLLLTMISLVWGIFETSSSNRNKFRQLLYSNFVTCSPSETPFRLELETDQYPEETAWELRNVNTDGMVIIAEKGGHETPGVVYNTTFCLETMSCHQFKIKDKEDDGICCSYGTGWYKIFYNDILVMEGSDFGSENISELFGGRCPTPSPTTSPSISFAPTTSTSPSISASSKPSSKPSISSAPSELPTSSLLPSTSPIIMATSSPSTQPTWSPTISNVPTSSSTELFEMIGKDQNNRRYFPKRIDPSIYPEGIFPNQSIPDCNSTIGRVGCVALPRSFDSYAPHWAGKIHSKPHSCDKRKRRCEMGIPMSRKTTSFSDSLISINPFKDKMLSFNLPDNNFLHSKSVAIADVNNDGMLDIIVGNDKQNNQILINAGNGNFEEIIDLPDSSTLETFSIVAADVNNDGMVDIIVGNRGHENQLLINADNGSFENVINLPGGALDTRSITTADVNNDGVLDIIIGNDSDQTNQLLVNTGFGSFVEIIDLPGGLLETFSIVAADVDGDGRVDIIVGNYYEYNKLLRNKDKGGNGVWFEAENILTHGTKHTTSIAVADINNDGMVDIVIGNAEEANQLLMNDGYGNFTKSEDLPGGVLKTQSIAVADMDNDGMVDIIVGNEGGVNQILINHGSEFGDTIDLPSGRFKTQSIAAADMNNDGMVDVIVGNEEQSNQQLRNTIGDGAFEYIHNLPGSDVNSRAIVSADVNNDGILDIIVGNKGTSNQLLMNAGGGLFEDPDDLTGYYTTYDIVAADMNNDGWIDILVGNYQQRNQLLFNLGDGKFGIADDLPGGTRIAKTTSIAAVDINNDGMLDIILGNEDAPNQLLINRGGGKFNDPPIDLPSGAFPVNVDTTSIVAADINNDGMMDIIVGNKRERNQLLLNTGNGTFFEDAIELPGNFLFSSSIAVADVNDDGMLDIVVGNWLSVKNQLLINTGNGTFADVVDLPGGSIHTQSIAVADINNDGMVDILVGNIGQRNQLLINEGDGSFKNVIDLPGEIFNTYSLAIADLNNDGMLDVLIGNNNYQTNQFLPYSPCDSSGGGARLHSKSWCFKCPSFMGRDIHASACKECHPDFTQQPLSKEEKCVSSCPLKQRMLGEDECSSCPDGSYYDSKLTRIPNNFSTWERPRCVKCSAGEHTIENITALDKCFECAPGTYQPEPGQKKCEDCKAGEFQTNFKQDKCDTCAVGGYCDAVKKIDGGFTPCPPGTFNDKPGQSDETACQKCPSGTYSPVSGVNNTNFCIKCPLGAYSDEPGQIECKACAEGKFQDELGQTSCKVCQSGTYSDNTGFKKCIPCPFILSSMKNSSTCPFCAENFYLNDTAVNSSIILQNPSKYCSPCPEKASCPANTNILDIGIPPGYWRRSRRTKKFYKCEGSSNSCIGSSDSTVLPAQMMENDARNDNMTGIYCKERHTGPLCEVCLEENNYFDITNGQCKECPSLFLYVITWAGIFIGSLLMGILIWRILKIQVVSFFDLLSMIGLQAKLKLMISFYQVVSSLKDIYGIKLSNRVTGWTKVFDYLSLDFIKIAGVPANCIGSMKQQLLINAAWPYMIIITGALIYTVYFTIMRNIESRFQITKHSGDLKNHLKKRMIQLTIMVLYFSLPTVSRSIFNAIKCRSFQINDEEPSGMISYLVSDRSIVCNRDDGSSNYASILVNFWILAVIWVVLTPLGLLLLCLYIRESVRSKSITVLADTCRFLWDDYEPSMLFWDVLDTMRKIFLTGIIMLIDINQGSNKMLRIVVGNLISVGYTCILLSFRPYKRHDDYMLAFFSNFLLICCFTSSTILKMCDDEDEGNGDGSCDRFIGKFLNSFMASILVIMLTLGMLFITCSFIVILAINKIRAPKVLMTLTGHPPNLELPVDSSFHLFMSHVWATGQAATHTVVRTLQLNSAGLKIWLDIDELYDISKLEESVESSLVFGLFYSTGYFGSNNCRREVYAAIKLEKPIILMYLGDDSVIERMKQEIITYCDGDGINEPNARHVLKKLFGDDETFASEPIQWMHEGAFSAACLKRIYNEVFRNLPYYQKYRRTLASGIMVPNELGPVALESKINILVYSENQGCAYVADELALMMNGSKTEMVTITDAKLFVENARNEIDYNENVDLLENQAAKYDPSPNSIPDTPNFLLFYLNTDTFVGDNREQTELLKACINDPNITIILVHEKDVSKGACEFNEFFSTVPQELVNPPYKLFKDIAIPLFSNHEYRDVSLRRILLLTGAIPIRRY